MNNRIRDYGPMCEATRQSSRLGTLWLVYLLIVLCIVVAVTYCTPAPAAIQHTVERPDQFPPGPVCPFGDESERYCL